MYTGAKHIAIQGRRKAAETVRTQTGKLVHSSEAAKNGIIFHYNVAGERGVVGKNDVVPNHTVMSYMDISHEQIVITNLRQILVLLGPAMHRHRFPDGIAVADHQA